MGQTKTGRLSGAAGFAGAAGAVALVGAALAVSCNDFYHDVFGKPPEGDRIVSFVVPGEADGTIILQTEDALANRIAVRVYDDAAPSVPQVTVSEGATLIPITRSYVASTFPGRRFDGLWNDLTTMTGNLAGYTEALVKATSGFAPPALDREIDFLNEERVGFLVVSGAGTVRWYRVDAEPVPRDGGEVAAAITAFDFLSADNDFLAGDSTTVFDGDAIKVRAMLAHHVDLGRFALKPTIAFEGILLVGGQEYDRESTLFVFTDVIAGLPQVGDDLVVHPTDGPGSRKYALEVVFGQEPPPEPEPEPVLVRFDFPAADNPDLLCGNAVGKIVGNRIDVTATILRDRWAGEDGPYRLVPALEVLPSDAVLHSGGEAVRTGEPFEFEGGMTELTLDGNGHSLPRELWIAFVQEPLPEPVLARFDFLESDNPGLLYGDAVGEIAGNRIDITVTIRRNEWNGGPGYRLVPRLEISPEDGELVHGDGDTAIRTGEPFEFEGGMTVWYLNGNGHRVRRELHLTLAREAETGLSRFGFPASRNRELPCGTAVGAISGNRGEVVATVRPDARGAAACGPIPSFAVPPEDSPLALAEGETLVSGAASVSGVAPCSRMPDLVGSVRAAASGGIPSGKRRSNPGAGSGSG